MSLTSFVKKSEVRDKIDKIFTKPSFGQKNIEIKAPSPENYSGKDYMLIGTAFDYLLRFYLKYKHFNKISDSHWVAHTSLYSLMKKTVYFPTKPYKKSKNFYGVANKFLTDNITIEIEDLETVDDEEKHFSNLVDYFKNDNNFNTEVERQIQEMFNYILNAEKFYNQYLGDGKLREKLLQAVVDLAKIDGYYRGDKYNPTLGEYKKEYLEDLKNLYKTIPNQNFSGDDVYLNPTFGQASSLVGGADADLIIDGSLIDIKTTKNLSFTVKQWRQLIGYLTLIDIQGKFDIDKAGIYFSRHGYIYNFDADKVYSKTGYKEFKEWFGYQT